MSCIGHQNHFHELAIIDLPPQPTSELLFNENFLRRLANLTTFELLVRDWYSPFERTIGSNDKDYPTSSSIHKFIEKLPRTCLRHIADGLRELDLGFRSYVILYPKLDLRSVVCRSLTTLKLAKATLTHEWQLK